MSHNIIFLNHRVTEYTENLCFSPAGRRRPGKSSNRFATTVPQINVARERVGLETIDWLTIKPHARRADIFGGSSSLDPTKDKPISVLSVSLLRKVSLFRVNPRNMMDCGEYFSCFLPYSYHLPCPVQFSAGKERSEFNWGHLPSFPTYQL